MLKNTTLFILGAGASAELRMPVGAELGRRINQMADLSAGRGGLSGSGDRYIYDELRVGLRVRDELLLQAYDTVRKGSILAASIDDFLNTHQTNALVQKIGKASIVKAIIEAEKSSLLSFDHPNKNSPNWEGLDGTWYVKLFRMLSRGVASDKIEEIFSRVRFITFNYDRSLETFLAHAIKDFFSTDWQTAAQMVVNLNIIHPYGTVGKFEVSRRPEDTVERYGYLPMNAMLSRAAGIRTYSEQIENESSLFHMQQMLRDARTIVFLGFAYHPQNMKLLKGNGDLPGAAVLGTTLGFSDPDKEEIKSQILNLFHMNQRLGMGSSVALKQLSCGDLLDYYSKALA